MALTDYDDQPILQVNRPSVATDSRGMQVGQPAPEVFTINGRISSVSGRHQEIYMTLGIVADAELFTAIGPNGSPGGGPFLVNGDSITDDQNVQYLIVGRARRISWGNIDDYWKYPLRSEALQ